MNRHERKQAWLAARNRTPDGQWLLGGSELASVLGWDPWCDAFARWSRKLGLLEDSAGEAAEAGTYLEAGVLRWYADRYDRLLVTPIQIVRWIGEDLAWMPDLASELVEHLRERLDVYYADADGRVIFRSKTVPWATCSIDAFVFHEELGGWGVVDAKCTGLMNKGQWLDAVPPDKLPQLTHYLTHTGLPWGGWAVCFGGESLERFDVTAEQLQPVQAAIDEAVPPFLQHLQDETPPLAEPSGTLAKVLAVMRDPKRDRKRVLWTAPLQLPGKAWEPDEFDELWCAAQHERKAMDDYWGKLQAVLRLVLGDATEVCLRGGIVYRLDKRNGIRRISPKD